MTKVIFRTWKDTKTVIALFPEIKADLAGNCESYMSKGGHGAANYDHIIRMTRPSTWREYDQMWGELNQMGYYMLKQIQRKPRRVAYLTPVRERYRYE